MSTARSVFTESIEDHLALKKQNSALEAVMPLARYDVGDPLDRYPGGPNRAADGTVVIAEDSLAAFEEEQVMEAPVDPTAMMVGPSPEQAMEAATALEPAFADHPFEPLTGMAPMLSLVEDIEEEDDVPAAPAAPSTEANADVLRFPGGVGPRDEVVAEDETPAVDPMQLQVETHSFGTDTFAAAPAAPEPTQAATATISEDAPTGEQPVLVIDTDEPLATSDWNEPAAPARSSKKPRFFGIGRKKSSRDSADGWFTDGPRDFNWD